MQSNSHDQDSMNQHQQVTASGISHVEMMLFKLLRPYLANTLLLL